MIYYCFIVIAAVMFGLQFFFNREFQQNEGNSMAKTVLFSLITSAAVAVIMFVINKGKLEFTLFSCAMAFLSALVGVMFTYFSVLAFDKVNLSVYSLFSMLGGMILPVIYGVAFYAEDFSPKRVLCVTVIITALFIGTDLKADKKTLLYCIAVFMLNGLAGVISKCHQSSVMATSSSNFMLAKSIITLLICAIYMFITGMKITLNKPLKSIRAAVCFSFMTGIANLLVLIALTHVNASVQYPMITGGTIVVSVIISLICKEKVIYKNILSAVLALVATLLII